MYSLCQHAVYNLSTHTNPQPPPAFHLLHAFLQQIRTPPPYMTHHHIASLQQHSTIALCLNAPRCAAHSTPHPGHILRPPCLCATNRPMAPPPMHPPPPTHTHKTLTATSVRFSKSSTTPRCRNATATCSTLHPSRTVRAFTLLTPLLPLLPPLLPQPPPLLLLLLLLQVPLQQVHPVPTFTPSHSLSQQLQQHIVPINSTTPSTHPRAAAQCTGNHPRESGVRISE